MIIADDDNNCPSRESLTVEIDLKCAERVTDSDVEESNMDSSDTLKIKVNKIVKKKIVIILLILLFIFLD